MRLGQRIANKLCQNCLRILLGQHTVEVSLPLQALRTGIIVVGQHVEEHVFTSVYAQFRRCTIALDYQRAVLHI